MNYILCNKSAYVEVQDNVSRSQLHSQTDTFAIYLFLHTIQGKDDIHGRSKVLYGGIAGRANYGNADINFKNLTNSGDVTGLNRVGGIIGFFNSTASVGYNTSIRTITVLNNSNTGDISGTSFVGGIFG